MIRATSIVFLFVLSAQQAEAQLLTVASGVKSRIVEHWAVARNCAPQHLVGHIVRPPAHGKASLVMQSVTIPATNGRGAAQACVGRRTRAIVVYYQSQRGYVGEDSFSYTRINIDNAGDHNNGEHSRTVSVR